MYFTRKALVLSVVPALVSLAACSTILGIDYPPLREEGADADADVPDVLEAGDEKDTGGRCPTNEPQPCQPGCPHAFCDDFEDASAGFPTWQPPSGIVNPFISGDGSVTHVEPGASSGRSVSFALEGDPSKTSGALLLHRLPVTALGDPARLDGIRLAFDGQIRKTVIGVGGPVPDAGSGLVASLANGGAKLLGPTLVLTEHAFYLAIVSDFFNGGTTAALERITDESDDVARFLNTWARLSLYSGTAARAKAVGYTKCPDAPYVFAGSWGPREVCIAAPEGYDISALATDETIILGTLLRRAGSLELRYDNVHVDAYTP